MPPGPRGARCLSCASRPRRHTAGVALARTLGLREHPSQRQPTILDRILADFSSWHWWITVVVVGFAVNLASSYTKSPLDRLVEHFSRRRAAARTHRNRRIQDAARLLLTDSRLVSLRIADENRYRMLMLMFLVFGAFYAGAAVAIGYDLPKTTFTWRAAATVLFGLMTFACIVLGMWMFEHAKTIRRILVEFERLIARPPGQANGNARPEA